MCIERKMKMIVVVYFGQKDMCHTLKKPMGVKHINQSAYSTLFQNHAIFGI